MRTDVNAYGCTQGCVDIVRKPSLKVDFGGKNPLPHQGLEPTSAAYLSDALSTKLLPPPTVSVPMSWHSKSSQEQMKMPSGIRQQLAILGAHYVR